MMYRTRRSTVLKVKAPHFRANAFQRHVQYSLREYCRISTLHGFRNIAAENSSLMERTAWFFIVVACCILTVIMTHSVWHRFQISPTMTTIQSNHHSIADVPFPAVTICNTNVIARSSAEIILDKLAAKGVNRTLAIKFLRQLPQAINNMRPLKVNNLKLLRNATKALGYTLETLLYELAQPCSRLLHQCLWLGKQYNCSSMFVHLPTSEGFCCSFNWHGAMTGGYSGLTVRGNGTAWKREGIFLEKLYVSSGSVPNAGLALIINTESEDHFASINSFLGAVVLLHHPDRYPDIYVRRTFVQPRFEVTVRVTGSIVESSSNVRSLNPQQRQCFFQDEVNINTFNSYNYDTCTLDCKMATYERECSCVPFYYPNITSTRNCDLEDWKCLYEHKGVLSSQHNREMEQFLREDSHCNCLPACSEVNYDFFAQGNQIYLPQHASPDFEGDLEGKSSFSVFFQDNVCIKYRRVSQMTWDTLIASFGGIIGLYLGGSVLSVIELVYYLTFKLWRTTYQEKSQSTVGDNHLQQTKRKPVNAQLQQKMYAPIWHLHFSE